ncbi:MAG: DeoR/GlpR family DNA-binding transcription regulator, partial [Hyphomicrobiales bacterium]
FPSNTSNLAYMARREIASEGKRLIAQEAAKLIPNNASLFINIGTTTEQVAHALRGHQDLIVVTNNLNVAVILSNAPKIELVIAGGTVRKSDGGIVGAATIDLIRQFKVDFAIIGASAIDEDGALLDFDYGEVRVAQAIMAQARRKILVADSTKFERRAPVHIGRLADINVLITDTTPPKEVSDLIDAVGTELIIASANVANAQSVDR